MSKIIDMLRQHCIFNNDKEVYCLIAVARRKDNETITNSKEIVFRAVIKKPEDIARKYLKILASVQNYQNEEGEKFNFYLYVSVNPRDVVKAYFKLQLDMQNWIKEHLQGNDQLQKFKRIDNYWYSALMSPSSKSGRGKWLVDLDTQEAQFIKAFENKIKDKSQIMIKQKSVNGYHYVITPFDRRDYSKGTYEEIKPDALLFVEYIKKPCKNECAKK